MQCRSCGRKIGFGESVDNGICPRCRRVDRSGRGAAGVGFALVWFGFRVLSHGDAGLIVILLGVAAIFVPLFLLLKRALQRRNAPPDEQETEGGPQIAGQACVACEEKILSVLEAAAPCTKCGAAVHEDCIGKHMIAAHGGSKKHPYRK